MIKKVGTIVRFNVISYLLKEGIRNVFKNKKSTISCLMIMCATMLIFGLFLVIGENINAFVKSVADAQGIMVYLKTEATDEEIENFTSSAITAYKLTKEEGYVISMRDMKPIMEIVKAEYPMANGKVVSKVMNNYINSK